MKLPLLHLKTAVVGIATAACTLAFTTDTAAQTSNDNQAGAILINHTSTTAGNNRNSTGDGNTPACISVAPTGNVWYRFQATSTNLFASLSGSGTFRNAVVALWDNGGTFLDCGRWQCTSGTEANIHYNALTIGQFYFVSVDAINNEGDFILEMNASDHNLRADARTIANLNPATTYNGPYFNTANATPNNAPTCWPTAYHNVWYQFVATTDTIHIQLNTCCMKYPLLALEEAGGTELACATFSNGGTQTITVSQGGLTPGNTYFVSVDNCGDTAYWGGFALIFDDGPGGDKRSISDLDTDPTSNFRTALFPNPASESTTVVVAGDEYLNNISVELRSITGTVLQQYRPGNSDEFRVRLNLTNLTAGIYFVVTTVDGRQQVEKLVVTR
jgi:hypothetical protein